MSDNVNVRKLLDESPASDSEVIKIHLAGGKVHMAEKIVEEWDDAILVDLIGTDEVMLIFKNRIESISKE